jgi:hypothetical protein
VAAMTSQSRRVAGIVLIVFPTVVFGGVSVLTLLVHDPTYADNALRQALWRAGHAHAGVLLLLTLVVLRYVDETGLSEGTRWYVRLAVPAAAVLLPIAFFLSVLSPDGHPTDPARLPRLCRSRRVGNRTAHPRDRAASRPWAGGRWRRRATGRDGRRSLAPQPRFD